MVAERRGEPDAPPRPRAGRGRVRRRQHRAGAAARLRDLLVDHRPGQADRGAAVRDRGGDFSRRVEVPNRDELGALAADLNRTNDELGRLYAQLEAANRHKSQFLASMSPRAAHAAQRRSSASPRCCGAALRRAERAPGGATCSTSSSSGRHLLGADQRHPRPLQGRGRADGAASPSSFDVRRGAARRARRAQAADRAEARSGSSWSSSPASRRSAIEADERKVRQVIYNLLSNANKFTPDGGAIRTRARLDGRGQLEVAVADTGVGHRPGGPGAIFEEFRQVEPATRARSSRAPASAWRWRASSSA